MSSGVVVDTVLGARYLHEIAASDPDYTGRVTVPVLWDKQRRRSFRRSSEIIRMLNSAFDEIGAAHGNFYPPREEEIDRLNARIYATVNNGVYRAGFAKTQQAYQQAVIPLFETLNQLDRQLGERRVFAEIGSRKPTGGCSRRWSGSIPSISAISSAI